MTEVIPANDAPFCDFCKVLDTIKSLTKKDQQNKVLTNYINTLRVYVANITGKKNSSLYPVVRLLVPEKERERPAYNIKEHKLGQLLVKSLSLSKSAKDAEKLLNYRSVSSAENDYAGVAYYVLKKRDAKKARSLTIGEINDILDKIATAEVGNKGPVLDEAFSYALNNLSADQMKWFLRIILKDLKLGMGIDRRLAGFHADAPSLFENCGNLAKVCEELEDGDTRPLELGVRLFYAVSPMLSERLDVTRLVDLPTNRVYQIELKFDGERFQMHMENGVFEYFSRKGYKYSENYGKTYDSGLLTPMLKDCFSPSVNSVILDGEMMGWHKHKQCFGSKGMAFDVKKITVNSRFRPCYCVFDVLYLNGKSLVGAADKGGLPLAKRLAILNTLFTDKPGVIVHSEYTTVNNSDIKVFNEKVVEAINSAMDNEDEGIVVKDIDSYYLPSKRNGGWYKIKPEYTASTMEDLDLVIIGADEAENKRRGSARSFHVACADVVNPGDMPHRWLAVGKVATGFTDDERGRVCGLLEKNWVPWKHAPPPANIVFNKEKADYWINPEHSVVLQVRASELISCKDFGTDYTLRFPRVVKIRDDKPVHDAMTLNHFNQLCSEKLPVVKLSNKRVNVEQVDAVQIKTRRKREAKVVKVADQFRTKPSGEVEVKSQALSGRKLHVLSGDEECTKQELVAVVEAHGGKHVENIGSDTWCCVVGKINFRARNLIQAQELDILPSSWLKTLPPDAPAALRPLDMLSIKKDTRLKFSRDFDKYGDSYTEEIDVETLKKCFNKMEANVST
ncbi:hypothetical protein O0L34_g9881 [Tuta absoluta]|nr:hypothetical protein O0L34_g9881 [Tuta absoluta]